MNKVFKCRWLSVLLAIVITFSSIGVYPINHVFAVGDLDSEISKGEISNPIESGDKLEEAKEALEEEAKEEVKEDSKKKIESLEKSEDSKKKSGESKEELSNLIKSEDSKEDSDSEISKEETDSPIESKDKLDEAKEASEEESKGDSDSEISKDETDSSIESEDKLDEVKEDSDSEISKEEIDSPIESGDKLEEAKEALEEESKEESKLVLDSKEDSEEVKEEVKEEPKEEPKEKADVDDIKLEDKNDDVKSDDIDKAIDEKLEKDIEKEVMKIDSIESESNIEKLNSEEKIEPIKPKDLPLSLMSINEIMSANCSEGDEIWITGVVIEFKNPDLSKVVLKDSVDGAKSILFSRKSSKIKSLSDDIKSQLGALSVGDRVTLKALYGKNTYLIAYNSITEFKVEKSKVSAVIADVSSGEVDKNTMITLSCDTDDVNIYYTLDGSEPSVSSNVYSEPIEIINDVTVKAVAALDDGTLGRVCIFKYTLKSDEIPSGGDDEPLSVSDVIANKYSKGDNFWVTGIVTGFENTGNYKVLIKDSVDGDGEIALNRTDEKNTNLNEADKKILKNLKIGDKITLKAKYGTSVYKIGYNTISDLVVKPTKVSLIVASVSSGNIEKGKSIELSCDTENSSIYYTIDGSEPSDASTKYTKPIKIDENVVIKAIGVHDSKDVENSDVAVLDYKVVDIISLSDIGDVRDNDGDTVKIKGVVTFLENVSKKVGSEYVKSVRVYIQDDSAGIMVSLPDKTSFDIGDELELIGLIGSEYSMAKITPSSLPTIVDTNEDIVPQVISLSEYEGHEEKFECELIKVQDVRSDKESDKYGNTKLHGSDKVINITSKDLRKDREYDSVTGVLIYSYGNYKLIPRARSDIDESDAPLDPTVEHVNNDIISDADGAINVYFNKEADTKFAFDGNDASYNVNLEARLLKRINSARSTIDVATYEINLPNIIDALMKQAASGVRVRVVADAKTLTKDSHGDRYVEMVLNLEKMRRGVDGVIGTDDDIYMIADAPIEAIKDKSLRSKFSLPDSFDDLAGDLVAEGEKDDDGDYRKPGDQMHNKFVIVDSEWTWTGSWNYTKTGLYGGDAEMKDGVLGGNTQNAVEIHSDELANIYISEFEEMYGSSGKRPDSDEAKFHKRKTDNTDHIVMVGDTKVEVYFSVGDGAIAKMTEFIEDSADYRVYFDIFSWSASKNSPGKDILSALEVKLSESDSFSVKGNIDSSFYSQSWAPPAIVSEWDISNRPSIYRANEDRKLHSKTMIIDANTDSDPTVIIGSTNWSNNGENVNDENMLFIHDKDIANQFLQDFYGVVDRAGGDVPSKEPIIEAVTVPDDVDMIHDIQGNTHNSSNLGEDVVVSAVVTGVLPVYDSKLRKYFKKAHLVIQEEDSEIDGDDLTSEAIYVDGRIHDVDISQFAYGDTVLVKGVVGERVDEYDANLSESKRGNLTMTIIEAKSVDLVKKGSNSDLPVPIVIGDGGRVLVASEAYSSVAMDLTKSTEILKPAVNAIDFYECLEGMRVVVNNPKIVGITEKYGNLTVVPDNGRAIDSRHLTKNGGIKGEVDYHGFYRILMDDEMGELVDYKTKKFKSINPTIGDTISGSVNGVMLYSRGLYKLYHYGESEFKGNIVDNGTRREVTDLVGDTKDLTIASYNIENFSGDASSEKVKLVSESIVDNLKCPDIIGLIEVQDNDGPDDNNDSAADETYELLINGIEKNDGVHYEFVQIDPVDKMEGGQPGANIRVGYLYNPLRVQLGESKSGLMGASHDEAAAVELDGGVVLEKNPARIGADFDGDTPFKSTRRSLVTDFVFRGEHIFVIANHFSSKRGDTGEFGRKQPATKGSEVNRKLQAGLVNDFVEDEILRIDSNANVVLLGDMNDYEDSKTLEVLCGTKLKNLHEDLPLVERYSYVHEGLSQVLDNILVSDGLQDDAQIDVVHINAEFTHSDGRASDHDPVVAKFSNLGKDDFVEVAPAQSTISSGRVNKGQIAEFSSEVGSVIYYTLDGSRPDNTSKTNNSNVLNLSVDSDMLVKVIVIKDGHKSAVMTYSYELKAGKVSISDAKKLNKSFVVEGVVSHKLGDFGSSDLYFQDETGGFLIHLGKGQSFDKNIKSGSLVRVSGSNSSYKGKVQLKANGDDVIWVENSSSLNPKLISISDLGVSYDSMLVKLTNLKIDSVSSDKYKNTYLNFSVDGVDFSAKVDARSGDKFDKFDMVAGDYIDITGVLDISDAGIRLKSRNFKDIKKVSASVPLSVVDNVNVTVYSNYMPNLPKKVRVKFSDGSVKSVDVSWDFSKYNISLIGKQNIKGSIVGSYLQVMGVVRVIPYVSPTPNIDNNNIQKPSSFVRPDKMKELKDKIKDEIKDLSDKDKKKVLRQELKEITKMASQKKYTGSKTVSYNIQESSLQGLLQNIKSMKAAFEEDDSAYVDDFLTVHLDNNDEKKSKRKFIVKKHTLDQLKSEDVDLLIEQKNIQFKLPSDITSEVVDELIVETNIVETDEFEKALVDGVELISFVYDLDIQYKKDLNIQKLQGFNSNPEIIMPIDDNILAEDVDVIVRNSSTGEIETIDHWIESDEIHFYAPHFSEYAVVKTVKLLKEATADAIDKIWTIRFNHQLEHNSINESNVFVLDSNGEKVDIDLYIDNMNVYILPPDEGYDRNTKYSLYIKEVKDSKDNKLKQMMKMIFEIK